MRHEFNGGEDSTQIFTQYRFCPFSHVNEYPCIFKCEIYCRGILNFNCDAFNRTLCALITWLLLCCVYWCPFCVTAIWLLVLFILWDCLTSGHVSVIYLLFLNTSITIAHTKIYFSAFSLLEIHRKISE